MGSLEKEKGVKEKYYRAKLFTSSTYLIF